MLSFGAELSQSFAKGGSAVTIVDTLLKAVLAFTATALFVALAILIIRQLVSSSRELDDTSYTIKKVMNVLFIIFVICFLALGAKSLASKFSGIADISQQTDPLPTVTHHGKENGSWSGEETKGYKDL